jgi:hypothetical protein
MGLQKAQKEGGAGIVTLTPEDMKKHEAYMSMKLADAEVRIKAQAVEKMKWFAKEEGIPIATEVIPQDGKTVDTSPIIVKSTP